MTQRDLAAVTGIPQPMIARVERGQTQPRYDTLCRLLAGAGSDLEVAPLLGVGVDRSLIRVMLDRTPEERVLATGEAGRNLDHFVDEIRVGRRGR